MKPIYLQLYYKDTKKLIAQQFQKYNDAIEAEWKADAKNQYENFRAKYQMIPSEKTFRARTVKSGTQDVVFVILEMYATFLRNNEKKGLKNPLFKVNREGIRTKMGCLLSKTSIWRHIDRATQAGIFDASGYVFHGSNSSFQLKFNPAILVAAAHEVYREMVVENYKESVENRPIPVEKMEELLSLRPAFSDSFNGYMLPNWNHTVSRNSSLKLNINMNKDVFVDNLPLPLQDIKKNDPIETAVAVSPGNISLKHENINQTEKGTIPPPPGKTDRAISLETKFRGRGAEKKPENIDLDVLHIYIKNALTLILAVLYKGRFVPDQHKSIAKEFLQKYFNPEHKILKMSELYENLMLAVFEAHKAQTRRFFKPAPLYLYLDPTFKAGFYNTLKHVEKTVKPYMKANEDHAKSVRDLIHIYRIHLKDPGNYEMYRKSVQLLGKKKNKVYLEFFNVCVNNPEQFDNTGFHSLWNKTVNTNHHQKPN